MIKDSMQTMNHFYTKENLSEVTKTRAQQNILSNPYKLRKRGKEKVAKAECLRLKENRVFGW